MLTDAQWEEVNSLLGVAKKKDLYDVLGLPRTADLPTLQSEREIVYARWAQRPKSTRQLAMKDLASKCDTAFKNEESRKNHDRRLDDDARSSGDGGDRGGDDRGGRQRNRDDWGGGGHVPPPRPALLVHCLACGHPIAVDASMCPQCGWNGHVVPPASTRTKGVAALLCLPGFFGCAGLHRFYVGKNATGLLMFVTFGGFGVWLLIDLILILAGKFKDCEGLVVGASAGNFGYASQGVATGWQRFWRDPSGYFRSLSWGFRLLLGVFGAALLLDVAACPFRTRSGSDAEAPVPMPASVSAGAESEPSPVAVSEEDALGLSGSARRRIQSGLAVAGFDPGPVDGVFGSRTRQAIRQWQSQVGVSPTGYLTSNGAALLEALAEEVGNAPAVADVVDGARADTELTAPSEVVASAERVDPEPTPALGLTGRWLGRIEGFGRRYYADIIFEEVGARIRYPLSGCTGRLHVISGSSYREELTRGDECPANGRVTLRRLTAERVSYEWGYDSRSVEASGQLLRVAAMAEAGDESALSGTWSGEHGYTPYPSNEYSAELTIEPTGVVLRISWPCVFRLEPVSADSRILVYSAVHLEGFCSDGQVVLRRLGRDALWFETARVEDYGSRVGILNRGFD